MRANRKGLPQSLVNKKVKLADGASVFRRKGVQGLEQGGLFALKWKDKRPVLMLSTIHGATESWTGKNSRTEEGRPPLFKPTVIVDYTRLMGGVDLSDQLMKNYEFLRRSCKWWRKLWVHFFNMIVLNAFILNKKFGEEEGVEAR